MQGGGGAETGGLYQVVAKYRWSLQQVTLYICINYEEALTFELPIWTLRKPGQARFLIFDL